MELKYLTEIEVLRLDSNRIESSIPSALGSLSKLSELVLYRNALTGYLPKSFSNLVNLTTLHLSDNIFSGPLLDVDSISNLRTFRVDGNNFSGTIPKAFGGVYLGRFSLWSL
jgi:Leucine-rich repeat (LRR) protein